MEQPSPPPPDTVANNVSEADNKETADKTATDVDNSTLEFETNPAYFIGPLANPALAIETRFVPKDAKDAMAVAGSCGLYNLGNTCFMNAGLQCLFSSRPLLHHFLSASTAASTAGLEGSLTGAFYRLLCKVWSGRFSVVQPQQFKQLLGLYHPQFQDYRQHDCQEFLALLLDTFHEQLNQISQTQCLTSDSADPQGQSHLNNEDVGEGGAAEGCGEVSVGASTVSSDVKLLCPETLSSEEEAGGAGLGAEITSRSGHGSDGGQGRSWLKRSSPAETALVSEDSNHSSVSVHSTDSEQSSAFKRLKIDADPSALTSCPSTLTSCPSSTLTPALVPIACTTADRDAPVASASHTMLAVSSKGREALDDNNSAENGSEPMEMSPPSKLSIPQRKGVRTDVAAPSVTQSTAPPGTEESALLPLATGGGIAVEGEGRVCAEEGEGRGESVVPSRQFNNLEAGGGVPGVGVQASGEQVGAGGSDPRGNPLHFYCKESKTLNTNVLVSNFTQGDDVAIDSDKFAKVDNRHQVHVPKEVNLLQEALHGMEEDKVDKALICKTLAGNSSGGSSTNTVTPSNKSGPSPSNLRLVKTRAHQPLRKPPADPNLLNNSYELDDQVMVGYSAIVDTVLTKASHQVSEDKKLLKGEVGEGVGHKGDLVSGEVEKNVQMQALSKFKAAISKSNIREDISDKASTSESTETDDGDIEPEPESSASEGEEEEVEGEGGRASQCKGDNPGLPNPARCFTTADVAAANAAWECYRARNNSMVVNSFQGQFKSTVVCSECGHVSVTYEPFMYLSLPIPHAMERQICVVFVRPHKSTVRYLVTMHKNDKVQRLRRHLQTMTATENSDVILAEVLGSHISRLLDDNIMLRYVNDTGRTIHAFQMLPPPDVSQEENSTHPSPAPRTPSPSPQTPSDTAALSPCSAPQTPSDGGGLSPNPAPLSSDVSQPLVIDVSGEGVSLDRIKSSSPLLGMGGALDSEKRGDGELLSREGAESFLPGGKGEMEEPEALGVLEEDAKLSSLGADEDSNPLLPQPPPSADPLLMGTGLWEWGARHAFLPDHAPDHLSAPPTSPTSPASHHDSGPAFLAEFGGEAMFPQSPSSMEVEMDAAPPSQLWAEGEGEGRGAGDGGGVSSVVDQWQTCAICLEELVDSQLLTHQACAGIVCYTCLEMSAKHSGGLSNGCPICQCPVDVTRDFVPLISCSTSKCKVRILAVPVTFRQKVEGSGVGGEVGLVCSPRLVYLASQLSASCLYSLVDRAVPFTADYTLLLTDGQGLRCSRCDYSAHCTGCEVGREGEVSLRPGDCLTVHFLQRLGQEEVQDKTHVTDDATVQQLRGAEPTSIYDCFDAFTQSEVLDEHNPWYCPCCRRNQCAKKTMTVWRYPDNLIIHLKRFVYEDLSSTKIDNGVVFPFTSLDVTRFLAGPPMSFNLYDLYSIVCHHGGANSGHYTAFSCHPVSGQWHSYNDETVTPQPPGHAEFDSTYVLFYRRQGPQVQLDLKDVPVPEDDDDTADFGPAPLTSRSLPPSPGEPSTTAVVTFHTEGFDVVSDNTANTASAADNADKADKDPGFDFYV